MGRVTITLLQI